MPCMCGDPYCGSCGPAQGNYKCEICGQWSADGGCDDPKDCKEKSEAYWAAMAEEEARFQRELEENPPPEPSSTCPHGKEYHECNDCMVASDLDYDAMRERQLMGRF